MRHLPPEIAIYSSAKYVPTDVRRGTRGDEWLYASLVEQKRDQLAFALHCAKEAARNFDRDRQIQEMKDAFRLIKHLRSKIRADGLVHASAA